MNEQIVHLHTSVLLFSVEQEYPCYEPRVSGSWNCCAGVPRSASITQSHPASKSGPRERELKDHGAQGRRRQERSPGRIRLSPWRKDSDCGMDLAQM